jgi:hypothetical protein
VKHHILRVKSRKVGWFSGEKLMQVGKTRPQFAAETVVHLVKREPVNALAPDLFREWLCASLVSLSIPASRLGVDLGLGKNTLGDFLAKPGRDIKMGTAHKVHTSLVARAAAGGVELAPFLGASANG